MPNMPENELTCPKCRGKGKIPNPEARCAQCHHKRSDHHSNHPNSKCYYEVDRYEVCSCNKFKEPVGV